MPLFRPYADSAHDSGVSAYALGPNFILVEFRPDGRYRYDHTHPGRTHVQAMKRLALRGRGLATYINRHVRDNYAAKLR